MADTEVKKIICSSCGAEVGRHYCIGNTDYISGIVCGNGVLD